MVSKRQLFWAYRKNAELAIALSVSPTEICWKFRQEYPATVQEAFQMADHDSLIRSPLVVAARANSHPISPIAPLIFGVDVARAGKDSSRIIDRQGRRYGYVVNRTLNTPDLMQVARAVINEIEAHKPDHVFVDATGGYGSSVVDRLHELGFDDRVTGVEFAGQAEDVERYANKRAEIWARLRDHFGEPGGVDMVDDDELHRHLCAPGYKTDTSGRLLIERKEDIKKRVGFSPDGGDAMALTHSETVTKGRPRAIRIKRSIGR